MAKTNNPIDLNKITTKELIGSYHDGNLKLSKGEVKAISKPMIEAIEKGDVRLSVNSLLASILFDDKNTFETLRRKDCLRYSKYINKECKIQTILISVLESLKAVNYANQENTNYLESVVKLAPTLTTLRSLRAKIVTEIKRFRKKYPDNSLVKTLMAYNDFKFLKDHDTTDHLQSHTMAGRSKEEIASAVSYLIFTITEMEPLQPVDAKRISDEFVSKPDIENLILQSCSILDLKDIEIQVAHFNYNIEKKGKDIYVKPPSENFEKCLKLGFIRSSLQPNNDRLAMSGDADAQNAPSIEDVADDLLNLENTNFFKFKQDPNYPRYALEIPEPVLQQIVNDFIVPETFFEEDYFYLSHFFKEQIIDLDTIKNLKVKGELTAFEFLKIQRYFTLLQHMFSRQMLKDDKIPDELILRSSVPVFKEEQLYKMLEMFVPKDHIADFLDLVVWDETDERLLDIQYYPFIWIDDYYLVSLSVFAQANFLRNLYAIGHKEGNVEMLTDGGQDPVAEILTATFAAKGFPTATSVNYQQRTDIDFMTVVGDTLIICECKQSLLPTSVHDLRTPYDYIKKAEKQLDIFTEDHQKGALIGNIAKKNVIDLTGVTKLITCVVSSNRMFIGNEFKHPVRNVNEIKHFVTTGNISTIEGEFNTWKGNDLALSDLEEHFGNYKLLSVMYDSLSKYDIIRKFDNITIHETSYLLPIADAREKVAELTKTYKKLP